MAGDVAVDDSQVTRTYSRYILPDCNHLSGYFMAENMRQGDNGGRNFAPDDFEVGLAYAAGPNLQKNFILAQYRPFLLHEAQRVIVGFKN
jgi:hypothetical protein